MKLSKEMKLEAVKYSALTLFGIFLVVLLCLSLFLTSLIPAHTKKLFQTQISIGVFASLTIVFGAIFGICTLITGKKSLRDFIDDVNKENKEMIKKFNKENEYK